MQAITFSFENFSVRTLGTPDAPLFVAKDICKALEHTNAAQALKDNVDPEDIIKAEIDTAGGRQTVNCVNESGLYAVTTPRPILRIGRGFSLLRSQPGCLRDLYDLSEL